jgi:hypothetical protein
VAATENGDKPSQLERAATPLTKLEKCEVFLARYNNQWLPEVEAEWLACTGLDDETSDQVDAAAYAARHAEGRVVTTWGGPIGYIPWGGRPSLNWRWF